MGSWYIVVKTIKGRQYRYRQRTWREGNRVRTESYSLGLVAPTERGEGGNLTPATSAVASLTWLTTSTFTKLRDPAFGRAMDHAV